MCIIRKLEFGGLKMTIVTVLATVFIPLISAIFSGYSIYVTKNGNKDIISSNEIISKEVQAAEDKRNQCQIDANIVWNARVEWIQNVRRVTAEFITGCYKHIQEIDDLLKINPSSIDILKKKLDSKDIPKEKLDSINVAKEKLDLVKIAKEKLDLVDIPKTNLDLIEERKMLLILYFGPDGNNSNSKKAKGILDKDTNNGKNELIVQSIQNIVKEFKNYTDARYEMEKNRSTALYCDLCDLERIENRRLDPICECQDEDGGVYPFTDNDCEEVKLKTKEKENKYSDLEKDMKAKLENLSEAMRIYLKIEWNKTKNRKNID